MNKYRHFSYRDLKIVVENNPNDAEASEQFQKVCTKLRNSKDRWYYLGLGLCISGIIYLLSTFLGYIVPFVHKYIMIGIAILGSSLIILNIDSFSDKRLLAVDEVNKNKE